MAGQLQGELGGVAHRRRIARPVPGRAHPEELAQGLRLARHAEAADLRHVRAHEVDQAVRDQGHVFVLGVEELTHGDGHARLLAQQAEVLVLLGRERVLDEVRVIALQLLADLDRFRQGHALVDVVEQLHLFAQLQPDVLEELGEEAHVGSRLPHRGGTRGSIHLLLRRGAAAADPVGGEARHRHLDAHVPETLLEGRAALLLHLGKVAPARVVVAVGGLAHLAAQELVERHVGALGLDVPERLVHPAHGVEEHAAVPPVRADVRRLPDVLDLVRVPADQERPEVLLDRGVHHQRPLREGRAAQAVQPGLAGQHLHYHEPDLVGSGEDGLDVGDLQRRQAAGLRRHGGLTDAGGRSFGVRRADHA